MKYSLFKVQNLEEKNISNTKKDKIQNLKPILSQKYILSKKDIWGLDYVKKLKEIGVKSLKIEGRNKPAEYVGMATYVYSKALKQNEIEKENEKALLQMFNRSGKCTGYLDGVKGLDSITLDTPKNVGIYLGDVLEKKQKYVKVKLNESISMHDGIEIHSDNMPSTIVTCIKDEAGKILNTKVNANSIVWLGDISGKFNVGDKVYKTTDANLILDLNSKYVNKLNKRVKHDVDICITLDKVEVIVENEKIPVFERAEAAKTRMLSVEDIYNSFAKTENTAYILNLKKVNVEDGVFMPVSCLNNIRRKIVEYLDGKYLCNLESSNKLKREEFKINLKKMAKEETLYIYTYDTNVNYIDKYKAEYGKSLKRIYIIANDFVKYEEDIFNKYNMLDIFFVIPNVTFENLHKYITNNLERLLQIKSNGVNCIKGILLGSIEYLSMVLGLKNKYNITIGADYSLNITNSLSIKVMQNLGIDFATMSFELEDTNMEKDMENMAKTGYFEFVENLGTAMTSRYCILGSVIGKKGLESIDNKRQCLMPCKDNISKYYIQDMMGKNYNIVCDNIDCVMRLVRNKGRCPEKCLPYVNIRHVWL